MDERSENPAETRLSRALGLWVGGVRRRANAVKVGFSIATLALLVYTALSLGINASHMALLSEDLDFWREYSAFAEVFPIVDETLFVVVDAESPLRAKKAADALAAALEEGKLFTQVYVPGGGEYFETHALLYLSVEELEDITDNLASVQPWLAELNENRSLTTLVEVLEQGVEHAKDDPVLTENLNAVFDSVSLAAQAVLEERPKPISWDELLLRRKLPGDSARRLILLETDFDYLSLLPADRAITHIRAVSEQIGLVPANGVSVRVTGNPALNYDEMILVARGAVLAIAGSLVVVGLILWSALGSVRLVVSTLVTLLVGLVWTAAFAALAVGYLNVISVAFAVLFIGLGVDFGIHMCMRFAELLRQGVEPGPALDDTARGVGSSLALCAMTTAIGFFVFIPTDYRAIGELGLIAGMGMPISLFCSLTLLPALLSNADPQRDGAARSAPLWFTQALVPVAFEHARPVVWIAGGLALLAVLALPWAHFDHNVARMRDPSAESAQAFEDLLTDSDTSPWTMDAIAPSLEAAERVSTALEALPFVESTVTLADYVPTEQQEKLEVLSDLAFIVPEPPALTAESPPPDVGEQIAALRSLREIVHSLERADSAQRAMIQLDRFLARLESLENKGTAVDQFEDSLLGELPAQMRRLWNALDPGTVETADLPGNLTRRMLAPDGRARIEILPSEDLGDTEAIARFVDGVREVVPEATGSAVTILEWGRATVLSFQQALTAAIAVVAAVVWLMWRRMSDLFLVLTPLLLAALLTGAIAAATGIAFNFVNVVVLPLLLGIGVDSGIHLVHRYRVSAGEHRRIGGDELLGTSTAHAVFFSALTTMASFGTLALSGHGGISSMGQLLLIGVLLMLACNLVVLPALISLRTHR
jgi:hypothetical protein